MKLLPIWFAWPYAWPLAWAAIVGVDFGHKFTKAMMVAPGIRFEIIPNDGGNRKDLSAIYVDPKVSNGQLENAERAYGSQIGSLCSRSPESCAANLKSLLGKTTSDSWVEKYLQQHPEFHIVPNTEKHNAIAFELGRSGNTFTFSAEELAAMSLANLKERVIKALTHHPQARAIADDVAIAVPPYASQLSRYAFKDALALANYLSVLGLVDEGCAAALAYVSDKKFKPEEYNGKPVYQIIYDVGAGSTTATLFSYTALENKSVLLDVESVGHDDSLGGDLLTQHVYDILYKKFLEGFKLEKSFKMPYKMATRLTESAEKAKTILSANADSKVSLESFWKHQDFKATVSRQEFEDATLHLVERINKPILDALKKAPTGPKRIADIESVILNGGATRTPFVRKQLGGLLGDGKVSKVLNADEACAYGTTIRAYQLKLMAGASTDIVVNDRTLSTFEISVNGSNEKQLVFPKGVSAGKTSLINLGKVTGDRLAVGLHENGDLYGSYNITRLASKGSDLNCVSDEVSLYGKFAVGDDKVFSLDSLFVNCTTGKKAENEFKVDQNTTVFNFTANRVPKTKNKVMVPALGFTSVSPYTSAEKRKFLTTLAHLKGLEKDKVVFEHSKNILESTCYSLRSYMNDHKEVLSEILGESELDQIETKASDMVEWVDYESDSSNLKEIEEKLSTVQEIRRKLESTVKMLNSDLSVSALSTLVKQGKELAQSVQEYLLEFGSQATQVREKYDAEGLNFTSENEKIMKKIYGVKEIQQFDLERHFLDFKQALKNLTDLTSLSNSKFKKLTSQEKFDTSEAVNTLIREMTEDVQVLQTQHEQRITYLLTRLAKLKERKIQKELKAKLREEKLKEKAAQPAPLRNETESEIPELDDLGAVNETASAAREEIENGLGSASVEDAKNTQALDQHDEL